MKIRKMKKTLKETSKHFRNFNPEDEKNRVVDISNYTVNVSKEENTQKVRLVIISDTHGYTSDLKLPEGDILLHCGDFTKYGSFREIENFNTFLSTVVHQFKHIVVIAGNHDYSMDIKLKGSKPEEARQLLSNCIYLEDKSVTLMGIKFYGSPW